MAEAVWIETIALSQQSNLQQRWHHQEEKPNPADFLQTVHPFWNQRPHSWSILAQPPKGVTVGLVPSRGELVSMCQSEWNCWGNLAAAKPGLGCPNSCSCCLLVWARPKHWTKRKLFASFVPEADSPQEQPRAAQGTGWQHVRTAAGGRALLWEQTALPPATVSGMSSVQAALTADRTGGSLLTGCWLEDFLPLPD